MLSLEAIKKSLHETFSDKVFETHSLIFRQKPPGMVFNSLKGLVPEYLTSEFATRNESNSEL